MGSVRCSLISFVHNGYRASEQALDAPIVVGAHYTYHVGYGIVVHTISRTKSTNGGNRPIAAPHQRSFERLLRSVIVVRLDILRYAPRTFDAEVFAGPVTHLAALAGPTSQI